MIIEINTSAPANPADGGVWHYITGRKPVTGPAFGREFDVVTVRDERTVTTVRRHCGGASAFTDQQIEDLLAVRDSNPTPPPAAGVRWSSGEYRPCSSREAA